MPGQTLSGPGQAVVSPGGRGSTACIQHKLNRITVKGQTTILGSCSSRGNLNFTWRLLLAPLPVVDYVIIHELAHLLEMNHTPRFWQVVEGACPEYRRHLAWLRDMSATLYI